MDSKAILCQKLKDLNSVGVLSDRTYDSLVASINAAISDIDWLEICKQCLNAISEGADRGFYFGLTSAPDPNC